MDTEKKAVKDAPPIIEIDNPFEEGSTLKVDFGKIKSLKMRFYRRLKEYGAIGDDGAYKPDQAYVMVLCLVWEVFPTRSYEDMQKIVDEVPLQSMAHLEGWADKMMQQFNPGAVNHPT